MMNEMPSMNYFKKTTTEFVMVQSGAREDQKEQVLEEIDFFIKKTGGWENHYGMMFEGVCKGISFEDQLKQSEVLWQSIKFKFGKDN